MQIKNRQQWLVIAAVAIVGIFLADKIVITPLTDSWKARSRRIAALRTQIAEGKSLLRNEQSYRERWADMQRNSLPRDQSAAEQQFFNAMANWAQESRVTINAVTPQWKKEGNESMTYQCRVDASGNISSLSRFLYALEKDPVALRIESLELSAHDKQGQQLALGLQISGLVLLSSQK
jgi:hypothetical protein